MVPDEDTRQADSEGLSRHVDGHYFLIRLTHLSYTLSSLHRGFTACFKQGFCESYWDRAEVNSRLLDTNTFIYAYTYIIITLCIGFFRNYNEI